ncbi:hypothetical protein ACKKBG_A12425 [Auxenochlorella protothecoides x Auxenochlorella symbiontica]
MTREAYISAAAHIAKLGPELSEEAANAFLDAWPLEKAISELRDTHLEPEHVREICGSIGAALNTEAGVTRREEWLPFALFALHSPLAAVRTTASDQLHRALADVHYPEAWKVDACGRLIGIVGEEDAGEAGAGIAAGRLLGAATPGALLCRAAGLREELHRVALLPTAAPRLRALAVALEVVYRDADLAAPLLPAVRGALEGSRGDVLASVTSMELLQQIGKGRRACRAAVALLDSLQGVLQEFLGSEEELVRDATLVAAAKLVGRGGDSEVFLASQQDRLAPFIAAVAAALLQPEPYAALHAVTAMSRSRTAAALFLLDPARPGAVLVSLALGEEAHNASVRGAAQAALAGLAGGEGEEKGQQTGLDSLLPTDAEAALHAFVEEGQASEWPAVLGAVRPGNVDEMRARHALLSSLMHRPWAAARVCRVPEAMHGLVSGGGAPLLALQATMWHVLRGEQPASQEERTALEAAATHVNSAVAEKRSPAPQVATVQL